MNFARAIYLIAKLFPLIFSLQFFSLIFSAKKRTRRNNKKKTKELTKKVVYWSGKKNEKSPQFQRRSATTAITRPTRSSIFTAQCTGIITKSLGGTSTGTSCTTTKPIPSTSLLTASTIIIRMTSTAKGNIAMVGISCTKH